LTACAKYSCGATTGPLARLTKGDARRQPRRLHWLRPRPIGHRVPATRHAPLVHPFGPVSSSAELHVSVHTLQSRLNLPQRGAVLKAERGPVLQQFATNARRSAEKGASGRSSKEGRRAGGTSEGEGLRKAAMRSESDAPWPTGLHLVCCMRCANRQLVSRRRILKYSMYTMIQALELRATDRHAVAAGHRKEKCTVLRSSQVSSTQGALRTV